MTTTDPRKAARAEAWSALSARGREPQWLASEAKIDPSTVGDFLNGSRWPRTGSLSKMSRALGFDPDYLRAVGAGEIHVEVESAPVVDDADELEQITQQLEALTEQVRQISLRRGISRGQQARKDMDEAGQESQDTGSDDPA